MGFIQPFKENHQDQQPDRLAGWRQAPATIRRDLAALMEIEVRQGKDWYYLRTALPGVAGKALQAAGVAIPPAVRPIPENVVPKDKSAHTTI